MDLLLNVPAVSSTNNLSGLRHLYDFAEMHTRSLNSLRVTSDSYGSLLSSVLINKLPNDVRLLISRNVPEEEWKLDQLLKALHDELQARERVAIEKPVLNVPGVSSTGKSARQGSTTTHTAATLVSGPNPTTLSCCYCQQTHSAKDCKVVTQIEARKQILRRSGRCYVCLCTGHISRECRSKARCSRCSRRHHTSICSGESASNPDQKETQTRQNTGSDEQDTGSHNSRLNVNAPPFSGKPTSTSSTSLCVAAKGTVLLQTAVTTIQNPDQPNLSKAVRAVLDLGSQRSYITQQAAVSLQLSSKESQQMSIVTFGSPATQANCDLVHVLMKTLCGEMELRLLTTPIICEPLNTQHISLCRSSCEHISGLVLADEFDQDDITGVDVLLGADYYWELATGQVRRGDNGPIAVETKLGWVLSGPMGVPDSYNLLTAHSCMLTVSSQELSLDDTLRSFWELESLGINKSTQSVQKEFEESIAFRDGRYEVCLSWKKSHPILPDNYENCKKRLQGLLKRLRLSPDVLRDYDGIIRQQLEQGIIQPVSKDDIGRVGEVHYLPHHAVVKQDRETTKTRIVYDASAKTTGPSLNDCLCTGPSFNQKVFDILLRFRSYPVALTADIEKAFLMVSVAEADRDVLRFLWTSDVNDPRSDIQIFRFARVIFGVSSSPFLLNATVDHHLRLFSKSHPELIELLLHSIYVDDVIAGAESAESALRLYRDSKSVLKKGGFNLRKFNTNLPELQLTINLQEDSLSCKDNSDTKSTDDTTYAKSTLGANQAVDSNQQKVLGVLWNTTRDSLYFNVEDIATLAKRVSKPTKRIVTSIIGKFYDPLGFLSPIVVKFKIFFKTLCERGGEWDQTLSGDILQEWQTMVESLQRSPTFSIPRFYLTGIEANSTSYCLHGFCDASFSAYAAVIYLVSRTTSESSVRFVASKTRVSPRRELTIPRLELLSALLLARLIDSVTKSLSSTLSLCEHTCYTDSQVARYWIVGQEKQWKPFVQNRVLEIRELTPIGCWRHCPGVENPADLPSRGLTPTELSTSKLWHCGPEWLCRTTDGADVGLPDEMPTDCTVELRPRDKTTHTLLTGDPICIENVIKCNNYSSLSRLMSVTMYVLKFIQALKQAVKEHNPDDLVHLAEFSEAEILWIREAQQQLIKDHHFKVWTKQFGLYQDKGGIWRCGGRLQHANIPPLTQHPVILPRDHHLTVLVIKDAHSSVSQRYWRDFGPSPIEVLDHQRKIFSSEATPQMSCLPTV